MTRDPARLTDPASGASDALRALLRSSASDGPSAEQLQRLATKLGPQLAPAPATATSGTAAVGVGKVIVATVIVAVVAATGGYWFGRTKAPRESTPVAIAPAAVVEPPAPTPPAVAPLPVEPAPIVKPEAPPAAPTKRQPTRAAATAQSPRDERPIVDPFAVSSAPAAATTEDELAILGTAQRALVANDAGTALAQAERHAAKFPAGIMVEEREAIAIEALARLDRADDARTRFDRFRASYPRSSYRHRLERLITTP